MTTENIHPENRDVDTSVVENTLVSETGNNLQEPITQAASDVTVPAEQETEASSIPETSGSPQGPITQAASDVTVPAKQETEEQWRPQGSPLHVTSTQAETSHEVQEASPQTAEIQTPAVQASVEEHLDTQPVQEEIVRPFTDFIEEFRQSEGRPSPSEPFSSLLSPQEQPDLTTPWVNTPPESTFQALENTEMVSTIKVMENVQLSAPTLEESIQATEPTSPDEQTTIDTTTEQQSVVEQPPASAARPVSPLLRPAAPRGRGSRHGGHRHREEKSQAKPVEPSSPTIETPESKTPAAVEPATAAASAEKLAETAPVEPSAQEPALVEEQPRPPRRYRFDRKTPTQTPVARPEENKETVSRVTTPPAPRTNNGHAATIETEPAVGAIPGGRPQATATPQQTEQTAAKQPAIQEPALINETASATVTPSTPIQERHHAQEHQQIKEQPAPVTSSIPPVEPAPEVTAPVAEPVKLPSEEVAPEDLPPLEYSELQAATSRRRRRRRAGSGGVTAPAATTNAASTAKSAAPEATPPTAAPSPSPAAPKNGAPPQPGQYNIISGYTVNQMNQGNDVNGPFMGPDPSPARGSAMHTNVRPIRTESQRPHVYPVRSNEPGISANTMNQFVNAVTQALQNQTDRMVAELRHANQAPANISVTLPPFPSTERVGVFVDVANLLYSARTLRMTIDFGKLLDFLRGNRRLVRAHAYCPTSPQAGDEQMFLQAVKGLGYRITTKNYKTFSSGAKKADLDLDLCMDVVRLVDGRAVDCIVLVSGDSDFMPLLDYCADHGVRVEVAAFDEAMSATLRQSCDLFINLSMLDEIRA